MSHGWSRGNQPHFFLACTPTSTSTYATLVTGCVVCSITRIIPEETRSAAAWKSSFFGQEWACQHGSDSSAATSNTREIPGCSITETLLSEFRSIMPGMSSQHGHACFHRERRCLWAFLPSWCTDTTHLQGFILSLYVFLMFILIYRP
jgi:hypothetical protein